MTLRRILPIPTSMNWDWEKLQDQRRRQGSTPPPDFNKFGDELKRLKDLRGRMPGGPKVLAAILVALWLLSGIYIVEPDEVGVVQRFGAYAYTTESGPHYHLPIPIETVQTPKVTQVKRVEIGFRSLFDRQGMPAQIRAVPEESLMLTGDENIVDVQFIVQYRIGDPINYLFKISEPDATLKNAAEAAMREVIGNDRIDSALTSGKLEIQNKTRDLLQEMLNRYDSGMDIIAVQLQDVHPPQEVADAFKDVASAREDKVRFVNEADAYLNDIIPKARGRSAAMENEAQGYKEQQVLKARGEAARFTAMLEEYVKAPEITRQRLFLETMEAILANPTLEKIIMSDEALKQAVPYLPLEGMGRLKGGSQGAKAAKDAGGAQ